MSDQIEGFASDRGQLKRSPTHPHDEVRLPMGVCQEALQNRRAGVAAVGDPNLLSSAISSNDT